ncbi:hypothetical protein HRbin40_02456 [bacterium HR40]|nr:hypothetical protein HRbin40_02456 [bacterium HR40]
MTVLNPDKRRARSGAILARAAMASALLVAAHAPAATRAASTDPSAVPWNSGVSCFYQSGFDLAAFAAWRGSPVRALHGWAGKDLAAAPAYFAGGSYGQFLRRNPAVIAISTPLLPAGGTLGQCAAGAYDSLFRQIGEIIARRGRPDTILRLGWEMNLRWASWSAVPDPEAYKACFRRAVQAIRSTLPGARIDWTLGRGNKMTDWTLAYPGDDVVDIIGLSYYDRAPSIKTEADWDKYARMSPTARTTGILTVIDFARARGKKVAVGEWAVSDGIYDGFDNPLFVTKMHETFMANKDIIAYETYYNCGSNGVYKIYPEFHNPKAAAAYRQLW